MLEVNSLSAGYQGNDVVHDVTFRVDRGEAVMIIGSNGAGKTTLFKTLCGLLSPSSGKVFFEGGDITGIPAERIARLGMRFVSAARHLFPRMTIEEHLLLGAYPNKPEPETMSIVLRLFPRLAERWRQRAGTMSGGEQQMLTVGRALMSNPRLLVLDEPSTGLAPLVARAAYEALNVLRERGLTVLVTEQQVPLAMAFCDRGYVLENGFIRLEGTTKQLAANPAVRSAYLGVT
jgi:branched-chain amino acid transport system ATP-binding protein